MRVPTPEEEEEEEEDEEEDDENIQLSVEEEFPINHNRGPQAAAAADYNEDVFNRGPKAPSESKWYVNDNRRPPRAAAAAASCCNFDRRPPRAAAAASCCNFYRRQPRAAAAASCYDDDDESAIAHFFDSKKHQQSIRKELEDRVGIPSIENDMIERTFSLSDIPVYPLTSTRVETLSVMQISLDMKDIEAKIRETRAICESKAGTNLPICTAAGLSALGLMVPKQLLQEIKYQKAYKCGILDTVLLQYLYKKNIITSKTILDFENEADLITKIQILLRRGNSTIITVYGGDQTFSHVVLIVNAGPHEDENGRNRSGVYCVDILAGIIIELDGVDTPFIQYLSKYDRNTNSIIVYSDLPTNEKRGVKRKEKEEVQIRKKKLAPSKKRRLGGCRKTKKRVHL